MPPARHSANTMSDEKRELVGVLVGADPREGRSTLDSLIRQGDDAAAEIIGAALHQSNWPVCNDLADALTRVGRATAREALVRALKARRHHVRSAAMKALARLGGAGVRAVIAALANDPSYEVRQDVAEALGLPRCQEEPDAP